MTLAVVSRQPYSEVRQMDQRELDTLDAVVREINKSKGGRRGR
jgi:hypothetical protein